MRMFSEKARTMAGMPRRLAARVTFGALAALLSGCGLQPFTDPASNPLLEERLGTIDAVATTADRRLAYVRSNPINAAPPDGRVINKVIESLVNHHMGAPALEMVSKSTKTSTPADGAKGIAPTVEHKETWDRVRGADDVANLIHVGRFGGKKGEFCAEPSPDAIESVAAAFTASGEISKQSPDTSKTAAAAQIGRSVATAAAAMFRRSQGVQLYRDGAFFLCQAMTNGFIDAYEYRVALKYLRLDATDLIKQEIESDGWKAAYDALAVVNVGDASTGGDTEADAEKPAAKEADAEKDGAANKAS